jgi:hypothetical protein
MEPSQAINPASSTIPERIQIAFAKFVSSMVFIESDCMPNKTCIPPRNSSLTIVTVPRQ